VICLTFDVEERFHSHLAPVAAHRAWRMEDRILAIIDELIARERTATFFVVGELAERFPKVVRRMSEAGFEVASHSHTHPRFDRNSAESNHEEIARSRKALEDITGQPVLGFRAPSWSVGLDDEWLWQFLAEEGFRYDSSLFPFRTHMYGSWRNPVRPFRLSSDLVEIPAPVHALGPVRIPYGGGFYFRLYPWVADPDADEARPRERKNTDRVPPPVGVRTAQARDRAWPESFHRELQYSAHLVPLV
jgi:polysaccharide deacetylase family protein (PEP-CTERM system associated)